MNVCLFVCLSSAKQCEGDFTFALPLSVCLSVVCLSGTTAFHTFISCLNILICYLVYWFIMTSNCRLSTDDFAQSCGSCTYNIHSNNQVSTLLFAIMQESKVNDFFFVACRFQIAQRPFLLSIWWIKIRRLYLDTPLFARYAQRRCYHVEKRNPLPSYGLQNEEKSILSRQFNAQTCKW